MKNIGKVNKFFSLLITIIMMLSLLPTGVMATSDITVSVSVYDYTAVTCGANHASQTGVVLDTTEVTISNTSTALDAIKSALDKVSIPYSINSQYNYISSVNNLSEFDCGTQSGWVFSTNDDFGNMGASATSLAAGDKLKLHYSVTGYGSDVGSYWTGGPTITKLTLGNVDTVISSHTVYADANDYTGTTTYYLGGYKESGDNTPLTGMGTLASPYAIPIKLSESTDITNLTAKVESTLHPQYLSYDIGDGLTDISKATNYENNITLCLQTMGAYKKTYYTVSVTKTILPLPNYTGDWINFRGNEQNMGITTAKTPKTVDDAYLKWAVKHSSGWSQAITPPILLNDYLYIAKGKKIVKINPNNGEALAESEEMVGAVGYALNPITYGDGMIFVPVGNGQVQALRADTLVSLWVSEKLGGQTLTPLTYKNGYLYTGTWGSEIKEGSYFCLSVADEDKTQTNEIKSCTWKLNHNGGFYWAGAYATDSYVIFGSDDGVAGSTSETAILYSVNPATGAIIDTIEGVKGDIRSTVSYDSVTDRIYFTTKGGEFYQVKVNQDGSFDDSKTKIFDLGGMATGTPLVYNGLAYIGVSGANQFSQTGHSYKIIDVTTSPMKEVGTAEIPGYVQTSALLSTAYNTATNKVYVYATYNYTPGGIYVIEVEKTSGKDADNAAIVNVSGSNLYTPDGDKAQYCLCSLVSDRNGVIYYKNDSGYLMAVAPKPLTEKAITGFDIGSKKGIINETNKTVAVTVAYNADITSLSPTITISENATVSPNSGTATNFTNPVTYTVTAEDGTTQAYIVTVTKQSNSGSGGNNTDELSSDRTRAKASLLEAFNKCTESDYTTDNWTLVKSAYDTGIVNIENASTYNAVYSALNAVIESIGKINVKTNATITVCVSMEKFTLGQGYIIEPTLVKVSKYTPASVVITNLLKEKYPSVTQPYRITGTTTEGFYLSYVHDTDTNINVPSYILSALGGSVDTRGSNDLLGEFDYSQWSGWMYCVDGEFPGVGASSWRLNDKEVMRWQFTVFGYGADLDANNNAWGQSSLKSLADKDALMWRVAEINGMSNKSSVLAIGSNQTKYNTAMTVLTKIDSTQTEVDNALSALNNLSSGGTGGTGGGTTSTLPSVVESINKIAINFSDVEDNNWAKEYIYYLANKGIVSGKAENTFAPNDNITRAEFVAILSRISGEKGDTFTGGFSDVTASDWYANTISWAVKAGIVKGATENSFAPNDNITREQMASMIVRFVNYVKFELPAKNEDVKFTDSKDVSSYAKEAVTSMKKAGIINGKDNNMFAPLDNATRAEAAKMLAVLMQAMGK